MLDSLMNFIELGQSNSFKGITLRQGCTLLEGGLGIPKIMVLPP